MLRVKKAEQKLRRVIQKIITEQAEISLTVLPLFAKGFSNRLTVRVRGSSSLPLDVSFNIQVDESIGVPFGVPLCWQMVTF